MAANGAPGDDDVTDLPWASVFDPAANARALSAIQAQGFRAASDLVDRFADIARHATTGDRVVPETDGPRRAPKGLNPDVDMVISTWWTMIGQMFRAMRGEAIAATGGHQISVDVATEVAAGSVQLSVGGPDAGHAEIWLHNSGSDAANDVVLRCGDLLTHDGLVMTSSAVHFDPAVVPMPARSSRGVEVRVEPVDDVAPGRYRGMVLMSGFPDVWLPVEVAVRAPA
jgi:hypothetical protein